MSKFYNLEVLILVVVQIGTQTLLFSMVFFSFQVMSDCFATSWTRAHQAPLSLGILQARILEWVSISFARGSSWTRDQGNFVSCIAGRFFTAEPPGKTMVAYIKTSKQTKNNSSYLDIFFLLYLMGNKFILSERKLFRVKLIRCYFLRWWFQSINTYSLE